MILYRMSVKSQALKLENLFLCSAGDYNMLLQAVAGLLADARQIAEVARQECSHYRAQYKNPIPCKVTAVYLLTEFTFLTLLQHQV
jgi:hypothetical protein